MKKNTNINISFSKLIARLFLIVALPSIALAQSPAKVPTPTEQMEVANEKAVAPIEPVCWDNGSTLEVKVIGKWEKERQTLFGVQVKIRGIREVFLTEGDGTVHVELPQRLVGKKIKISVAISDYEESSKIITVQPGMQNNAAFLLKWEPVQSYSCRQKYFYTL